MNRIVEATLQCMGAKHSLYDYVEQRNETLPSDGPIKLPVKIYYRHTDKNGNPIVATLAYYDGKKQFVVIFDTTMKTSPSLTHAATSLRPTSQTGWVSWKIDVWDSSTSTYKKMPMTTLRPRSFQNTLPDPEVFKFTSDSILNSHRTATSVVVDRPSKKHTFTEPRRTKKPAISLKALKTLKATTMSVVLQLCHLREDFLKCIGNRQENIQIDGSALEPIGDLDWRDTLLYYMTNCESRIAFSKISFNYAQQMLDTQVVRQDHAKREFIMLPYRTTQRSEGSQDDCQIETIHGTYRARFKDTPAIVRSSENVIKHMSTE